MLKNEIKCLKANFHQTLLQKMVYQPRTGRWRRVWWRQTERLPSWKTAGKSFDGTLVDMAAMLEKRDDEAGVMFHALSQADLDLAWKEYENVNIYPDKIGRLQTL